MNKKTYYDILRALRLISKRNYLKKTLEYSKEYQLLIQSKYFDEAFYLAQNQDVAKGGIAAPRHYLYYGWLEGRDPSADFCTNDYLSQHPECHICPVIHYELVKDFDEIKKMPFLLAYETLSKSPLFDKEYYLNIYPDIQQAGIDPLEHYLKDGWKEGRKPSATFDGNLYFDLNLDVKRAFVNPLLHYLLKGEKENRSYQLKETLFLKIFSFLNLKNKNDLNGILPEEKMILKSNLFNQKWYLKTYPEIKKTGLDPLHHYLTIGWKEGKNPSPKFDGNLYLELNIDVKKANMNPLVHYVLHGKSDNRPTKRKKMDIFLKKVEKSIYFDEKYYKETYNPVLSAGETYFMHYYQKGWLLGYNPSYYFDTDFYLNEYPDIKEVGLNPLVHYFHFGKNENRLIKQNLPKTIIDPTLRDKKISQQKWGDKKPTFSIIVASYNYEKYITTTLDSLVNQTYKNFEVIVVDDGSKDNSVKVIKKYVKKYPNIFLHRHPQGKNKGLCETVKLALAKSKGDYICFCESDDYWTDNHLQRLVDVITSYEHPVLISNDLEFFGAKIEKHIEKHINLIRDTLHSNINTIDIFNSTFNIVPTFSAVCVERKAFEQCDFDSKIIPAWLDWWLWRQILIDNPLFYIDEKLTFWRIHNSYNSYDKAKEYAKKMPLFLGMNNLLCLKKLSLKNKILYFYHHWVSQKNKIWYELKNSKYFDERYYKQQYPEVTKSGLSALEHYCEMGWKLGYNPSKNFETRAYLIANPDLIDSGLNPLYHYVKYGKQEGRPLGISHKKTERISDELIDKIKKMPPARVLLISHELTLTGAPRALLNMALSLKKQGFYPVILSWAHGPMEDEIRSKNIDVVVLTNLWSDLLNNQAGVLNFCSCFQSILFNTLITLKLVPYLPKISCQKYCWIHEGSLTFDGYSKILDLKQAFSFFDKVYSVGSYSQSFTNQFIEDKTKSDTLLYAIPDTTHQIKFELGEKVNFILPGAVSKRKGQDIFVKAWALLSEKIKNQITVTLVGPSADSTIQKQLEDLQRFDKRVRYLGALPHDQLMKLYEQMHVVLCPSLDDPMPIVCTEAFILNRPVIVSDQTGTAGFVKDNIHGYKIKANDPQALAQAITNITINKNLIEQMGKNGREIYQNHFTPECFDQKIYNIIKEG